MTGRVEGKVAFVTGAARGQGRSHAVRLAQEGADIVAVDICQPFDGSPAPGSTPEDRAETADMVKNLDRRVVTEIVDVRDFDALKAAVDNGGIGSTGVKLHRMSEPIWAETIDVNLGGVWKTVKAGVPHLLAGGRGGSVIITSSVGGSKRSTSCRSRGWNRSTSAMRCCSSPPTRPGTSPA
ncbi:MAG: oxidoreductase, family [Mycobacterium sp.]|nr:oxidoreductase, family [Mycobacterium sp.]